MGTRSNVIVRRADGKWKRIYCHWDGYISHNGVILFEAYDTQSKAERLVRPGDLSVLDRYCHKPAGHTFDSRVDGYTSYYGRDRGETGVDGEIFDTFEAAWASADNEYAYVWAGGKWWVGFHGGNALIELKEAVEINAGNEAAGRNKHDYGRIVDAINAHGTMIREIGRMT